jgi:DnaK suppressor protein
VLNSDILIFFSILSFFVFCFVFWKNAVEEGFSSDQVLDSIFLMLLGSVIGGKFLFRSINWEFFRYQLVASPLILEGALIGGGIGLFIAVRRYGWDGWKIGDIAALSLNLFQFIISLGIYFYSGLWAYLVLSGLFALLYLILFILRKKLNLGKSSAYNLLRRLDKKILTGGLIAAYLTGSGCIAILFLAIYPNLDSLFWKFQVVFYLFLTFTSFFLAKRKMSEQEVSMSGFLPQSFIQKMKDILLMRKKEIKTEIEDLKEKDPFIREFKDEGGRDVDNMADEALEEMGHDLVTAEQDLLKSELKEVDESLRDIKTGTYGLSHKTGKPISPNRLEVIPTAKDNPGE